MGCTLRKEIGILFNFMSHKISAFLCFFVWNFCMICVRIWEWNHLNKPIKPINKFLCCLTHREIRVKSPKSDLIYLTQFPAVCEIFGSPQRVVVFEVQVFYHPLELQGLFIIKDNNSNIFRLFAFSVKWKSVENQKIGFLKKYLNPPESSE